MSRSRAAELRALAAGGRADADLDPVTELRQGRGQRSPRRCRTAHGGPSPPATRTSARPRRPAGPRTGSTTDRTWRTRVPPARAARDATFPRGAHARPPAPAGCGAGELLHDALAEGRQVVGRPARRDVAVGDDLLVDHLRPGVAQVGAHARPRGQPAAARDVGLDEVPRAVADRGDRLARLHEVPDERTAAGSIRSLSGFTVPPGSSSAS